MNSLSALKRIPAFPTRMTVIVIAIFWMTTVAAEAWAADGYRHFNHLKKQLAADGFDKDVIDALYRSPEIIFSEKIAGSYFRHREGKLNYRQFTSKQNISKARTYMAEKKDALKQAQKDFGVDPTVITAILLVETRLGAYVGASRVLSTLSTIAALENHVNRDILWREKLQSYKLSRKRFDRKAKRKARWAYAELKAFLTYADREGIDPLTVVGSYAGAMGIAQFMPSNIISLGVDGNRDGAVDLFTHPDAIASIANYLKNSGWKPGIDRKKAYRVIWSYNHSSYYANTVLEISDMLKGY